MVTRKKKFVAAAGAAVAVGAAAIGISVSSASPSGPVLPQANTPIKHVVVLFDENISFDHYFGTYPFATNPPNESQFHAAPGTPNVNGLSNALLTANPNVNEPERLDRTQAITCDQNHAYSPEQASFDGGLMDKFVQDVTGGGCSQSTFPDQSNYGPNGIVMDYYDGNTVTALWNYAQHYTLGDNSYGTQFGPSTPGAINLVSGNTNGAVVHGGTSGNVANNTLIGDAEPFFDACSNSSTPLNPDGTPGGVTASFTGRNVGDLMNTAGVTWGWFQGGFTPSSPPGQPIVCGTKHANLAGASQNDYVEHHEPFQYYQSTSNPLHVSPSSVSQVGLSDPTSTPAGQAVNHQYDLSWFFQALDNGNLPQVSFLKPPAYQNGHAGNSDPLDEQKFLVDTINQIEQSPDWSSTAIVIAYDDSDGWYDHQMGPIIRQSLDANDALNGPGKCGSLTTAPAQNDRCGVGPRTPLLVISPWARQNFVDNTFTEQASVLQFIEDNWNLGRAGSESADASAGTLDNAFDFNTKDKRAPAVILNDSTGEVEQVVAPHSSASADASPGNQASQGYQGSSSGSGSNGSNNNQGSSHSSSQGSSNKGSKSKAPKVTCHQSSSHHTIRVNCVTSSNAPTVIRVRLFHGRQLVRNQAARVRSHHARFTLRLGKNAKAGRYTIRLSVDSAGQVAAISHNVRVS
ncbi:MAG TPA: alkaline phosphatase family protein [Solirubrobacteraceae bacterium]